jgi:peroxiredoxin
MQTLLWTVLGLLGLLLFSLWAVVYQIVRQQGRMLYRLEALEQSFAGELQEGEEPEPQGLQVGDEFPGFALRDLAGEKVALESLRGRRLLLVNWSPDCGFCELIAADLAKLEPDLRKRGAEPVLVTTGSLKRIRVSVREHGLSATVLLQKDEVIAGFEQLGTPVAYLLDEQGRVAGPLAVGADEVLDLARETAGARRRLGSERSLGESQIEREGLRAGAPAPTFALPDVDGKTVSLAEYRGRKVLLVFSDPHCGPCEALLPELVRLDREHRGNNLQVLVVGRGDPAENRSKSREHGLEFPVVVQKGWKLSKQYGIFATPVAFLVSEDGVIERDVARGRDEIIALAERQAR